MIILNTPGSAASMSIGVGSSAGDAAAALAGADGDDMLIFTVTTLELRAEIRRFHEERSIFFCFSSLFGLADVGGRPGLPGFHCFAAILDANQNAIFAFIDAIQL